MWCFIFVESVHKQKCKNKHGFSVIFVINVIFFFFFVLEQLLNYSFKMDTFLGQMTAVSYTAGSLVHQLIIVITVYVTCVVFKAIDLYLSWFFICLSTFNSNKAE